MSDYWGKKPVKAPKFVYDIVDYKEADFRYLGQIVRPFQTVASIATIGKDYSGGGTIYTVPEGVRFYIQNIFVSYIDIDSAGANPATLFIGTTDNDKFFAVRTQTQDLYQIRQMFPMPFPYFNAGDVVKIWHILAVPPTADYRAEVSLLGFHLSTGTPSRR